MSISRAEESPQQQVLLEESLGLISGEYIFRYPPGVPLAVPGERIGSQLLEQILRERGSGIRYTGTGGSRDEAALDSKRGAEASLK